MKYTDNIYPKEIQEAIKKFVDDNPRGYSRLIKSKRPDLYMFVLNNTPNTLRLSTRMYWIINDIYDYPECELCHRSFTYSIQFNRGYHRYCKDCINSKDSDRTKHARETNLKKFGCISNFGNKENREKGKRTLMFHYGVDHNWKSTKVRNGGKKTCKQLYGDENYNNREKSKHTKLEKYGDENYNNPNKISQTWNKHAENDPSFVLERNRKSKQTKKERYGDENYSNTQLAKETLMKRYGRLHGFKGRYQFDSKKFDSSYELAYYIWLKDTGIRFVYPCPFNIEYLNEETNRVKTYCPDFLVEDNIVEIKGEHFFKNNDPSTKILINPYNSSDSTPKYKMKCMLDNNAIILSNNECQKYIDYVNDKYGKDFINSCKIECK